MPAASQWLLFAILCFASLTDYTNEGWPRGIFAAATFALTALRAGVCPPRYWLVFGALPLIGVAQLVTGTTVVPAETVDATLRVGAFAALFTLTRAMCADWDARRRFLTACLIFGVAISALCLVQMNTTPGRFLGVLPSFSAEAFGPYASRNRYAQFIEVLLPLSVWFAHRVPKYTLVAAAAGGLMYASVIAASSRAGSAVCTALILVSLFLAARNDPAGRRRLMWILLAVPAIVAIFTFAAGWDRVMSRLREDDPYVGRREWAQTSLVLFKERPLQGWGLGTWPWVYPHKAPVDDTHFVNRAHNDWAEYAVDGGIFYFVAFFGPFLWALPWLLRSPWAVGIAGVLLHAWVDYPFGYPSSGAWAFAMLGALYAERDHHNAALRIQIKQSGAA